MNTTETTLYFVGQTEEDAQCNAPFDSVEAAASFQEDNGGIIFMANTVMNADSLHLSGLSPVSTDEQFFPTQHSNPFVNGLEMTLYLTGSDADSAEADMPYVEDSDAVESATDNGFKVYEVQAFIDLDSLDPMA